MNRTKHQALLTKLPHYIPSDLTERDIRDLIENLTDCIRSLDAERMTAEAQVRGFLDDIDFQGYVDAAIDETALASEVSDMHIDLSQTNAELNRVIDHVNQIRDTQRGPAGPQGVPGPQGPPGIMGMSGVETAVFQAFVERMKDMEDRMDEMAQAMDELEGK